MVYTLFYHILPADKREPCALLGANVWRQSVTDVSPSCTVMTVPASTSVPSSMDWLSTRTELDSLPVVPENRISSPGRRGGGVGL